MDLASQLAKLSPTASKTIIAGIVANSHLLDAAGINTPIRLRHFFARVCVETGGLRSLEENLNYTAQRAHEVWPARFKTVAAAAPYAKNPQKLADKVYGGRMGNSAPGDGWTYRGSGLLQNTGRANFAEVQAATGLPVVAQPELLRSFPGALQAATIYWTKRNINTLADKDDTDGVCKAVNGGTNGLADQKKWLAKAAKIWPDGASIALPAAPAPQPAPSAPVPASPVQPKPEAPDAAPVAPVASGQATIARVQEQLWNLGYTEVGSRGADGKFDGKAGTMTATAVRAFRADNGLPEGDAMDDDLLLALQKAKPRVIAPERANAPPEVVRDKVPEVKANWLSKIGGYIVGIPAAIGALVKPALDNIPVAKTYIDPLTSMASDVPGWVWLAVVAGVAGSLVLVARHGEAKGVEAFKTGARR